MRKSSHPNPAPSPKPVSLLLATADDTAGPDSRSLVSHKIADPRMAAMGVGSSIRLLRPARNRKQSARPGIVFARNLWSRWRRYRSRLRDCRELPTAESVHQFRVATRRLLTFVLLLEPLAERAPERKAYRLLKRRLKILGKLRDAQIQRMEIAAARDRFPGLELIEQRLLRREQRLMESVLGRIRSFKTRKLQHNLEGMRRGLESFSGDDSDMLSRVRQSAQEAFDEVVKRRMAIDASDAETIHRTRVAFKKFRYIVEGLSPAFTGLTRSQLLPLSDFQTSMGIIQDLEITENWLREFLQEHPQDTAHLRSYLTHLRRRKLGLQRAFVLSADRVFEFWPIHRLDAMILGRPAGPVIRFGIHESGSVKFLGAERQSSERASETAASHSSSD